MELIANNHLEDYNLMQHQEVLTDMLDHIAKSTAVFKSQQIDDPEMTNEEKRKEAEKILFENPVTFLTRFGSFLTERHLKIFSTFKDKSNNYDVEFYISQFQKILNDDSKRRIIRNRRFEALRRLQSDGKYFSETEMENRDPLLYHQLVGQYLTEKEKTLKNVGIGDVTGERPSLSAIIIRKAERDALNDLRIEQEEAEEAQAASSDEEESTSSEQFIPPARWGADWDDEEMDKNLKKTTKKKNKKMKIESDEKALLLQEFRTCMYTKFLDGLDADFDYSSVDSNSEYDCLLVRSQDEEDKYFDDESCDNNVCTDTGIEDY